MEVVSMDLLVEIMPNHSNGLCNEKTGFIDGREK